MKRIITVLMFCFISFGAFADGGFVRVSFPCEGRTVENEEITGRAVVAVYLDSLREVFASGDMDKIREAVPASFKLMEVEFGSSPEEQQILVDKALAPFRAENDSEDYHITSIINFIDLNNRKEGEIGVQVSLIIFKTEADGSIISDSGERLMTIWGSVTDDMLVIAD